MFELSDQYLYKLESMPRGQDPDRLILNSCNEPYRSLVIDYNSNCLICSCDGWLPIPVGKVQDFNSLEEVWSSPIAQILQEDIANKKFTWCAVEHCGIRWNSKLKPGYELLLNIDESCNLSCPSCRRELIMHSEGPLFDNKVQDTQRILTWLEKFEHPIQIVLSGNGDPLASHIVRPLIRTYIPKTTQQFKLQTNGLLIKKQLRDSPILPSISHFSISVDAGSKLVYEDVRRPGKWSVLLENFDFLRDNNKSSITALSFCLQQKNYRDLLNFIELCNEYNFWGFVHQLDDWGTWNSVPNETPDTWTILNGTYLDQNVLSPGHPEYQECMEVIREANTQRKNKVNFSAVIQSLL